MQIFDVCKGPIVSQWQKAAHSTGAHPLTRRKGPIQQYRQMSNSYVF